VGSIVPKGAHERRYPVADDEKQGQSGPEMIMTTNLKGVGRQGHHDSDGAETEERPVLNLFCPASSGEGLQLQKDQTDQPSEEDKKRGGHIVSKGRRHR
jgi:hypothetical protein